MRLTKRGGARQDSVIVQTCRIASARPMRSGVIHSSAVPSVGKFSMMVETSMQSWTACEMMFAVLYGSGKRVQDAVSAGCKVQLAQGPRCEARPWRLADRFCSAGA